MKYEDALKEWGAQRIEAYYANSGISIDRDTVTVSMEFDSGYACCGGRDDDCYCSMAESPSAEVLISGKAGTYLFTYCIDVCDFNFVQVLGEIVNAGGTLEGKNV